MTLAATLAVTLAAVQAGQPDDTPEELKTPGQRSLYNNLGQDKEKAVKVDAAIKDIRSDDWRGVPAREQVIKRAIYDILMDEAEVERIFVIIKQQKEY